MSIKKNWFIQEPLDEKTFTWIRKNFQQRECSNGKFQRKSFVYQFALAFLQTKGMGFFSQGLGRGAGGGAADARTPLDVLDTDFPILACSRLSDRGEGAKTYEQKKTSEAFIISFIVIFSLFCCKVA